MTYLDIKIKEEWYKDLLNELENTTIRVNYNRKNVGGGRTQVFGFCNRRQRGYGEVKNNSKYPKLYNLLKEFGKKIIPFDFNTIQVNHNYKCKRHIDKGNKGNSIIIALGKYQGGELVIEKEEIKEYNINYKPLLFNGKKYYHYVNEIISGNRYSLVYY